PWDYHGVNFPLSECNPPGFFEGGPGLEGIPPVYSVVQQEALQEQHVVHSHLGIHQRHGGAMVPIFSESAGSVEKICGPDPVDVSGSCWSMVNTAGREDSTQRRDNLPTGRALPHQFGWNLLQV